MNADKEFLKKALYPIEKKISIHFWARETGTCLFSAFRPDEHGNAGRLSEWPHNFRVTH
jgi:hypothetical protein